MKEQDIEKRINELQSMLDSFKNELRKEVKPNFEVGKWYKHLNALCCYKGNYEGYGISCENSWGDSIIMRDVKSWHPIIDKEVEEALIKEAERRGFKEGTIIKSFYTWTVRKIQKYEYKNGELRMWGEFEEMGDKGVREGMLPVLINGKWAEIIKDEPIKVGGYEVKRIGKGYNCMFEIGCKKVSYSELKTIKALMEENKFKTISFDKVEVSLETINKIIKGDCFN